MRAVILVVSDKEKDTSSTSGMETSRLTSPLLQYRAASVVQGRLEQMEAAYLGRDFETFGRLTMQDSNQFHAVCLDTYPPIFYMNDVSKAIIRLCHVINAHFGSIKAAYTFDAGPNAVIYTLEQDVPLVLSVMATYFPAPGSPDLYCNKPADFTQAAAAATFSALVPADLAETLRGTGRTPAAGDVKYIFSTKSGPGPLVQPLSESLLDPATGLPRPPGPNHKRMKLA